MADQLFGVEFNYGILPKEVMKSTALSIKAKALYAYLIAYAGNKGSAFPSASLIQHELNISKDTFYKYLQELKDIGYIEVQQERESGKFNHNIYYLRSSPCPKKPDTVKSDTEKPDTINQDTNNNSIKNNNIKNNSNTKKEKEVTLDSIIKEYTESKELLETLKDFLKMRKTIKKPMTNKAMSLLLKKLDSLSTDDSTKIDILNQSIFNSWQGIFPLKEGVQNGRKEQPNNSSNTEDKIEYDFSKYGA